MRSTRTRTAKATAEIEASAKQEAIKSSLQPSPKKQLKSQAPPSESQTSPKRPTRSQAPQEPQPSTTTTTTTTTTTANITTTIRPATATDAQMTASVSTKDPPLARQASKPVAKRRGRPTKKQNMELPTEKLFEPELAPELDEEKSDEPLKGQQAKQPYASHDGEREQSPKDEQDVHKLGGLDIQIEKENYSPVRQNVNHEQERQVPKGFKDMKKIKQTKMGAAPTPSVGNKDLHINFAEVRIEDIIDECRTDKTITIKANRVIISNFVNVDYR